MPRIAHVHDMDGPTAWARDGNVRPVGRHGDEFGYRDDDGDIGRRTFGNKPLHEIRTLWRDAGFRRQPRRVCASYGAAGTMRRMHKPSAD